MYKTCPNYEDREQNTHYWPKLFFHVIYVMVVVTIGSILNKFMLIFLAQFHIILLNLMNNYLHIICCNAPSEVHNITNSKQS